MLLPILIGTTPFGGYELIIIYNTIIQSRINMCLINSRQTKTIDRFYYLLVKKTFSKNAY